LAAPLGDGRPTLVVRTYAVTPVQASNWPAAVGAAAALLAQAGVRTEWVPCSSLRADEPFSGPARCTMPYEQNEVALRIVGRPAVDPRDRLLLGDSMVDASSRSGTLATIYLERVESMARAAGVSAGSVLARAMAHELGHLLLGTSAHSARGLMRPTWTAEELTRNRPRDWMISADEARQMRQGLLRRTESDSVIATMSGGQDLIVESRSARGDRSGGAEAPPY
jgi:hypothetical protein